MLGKIPIGFNLLNTNGDLQLMCGGAFLVNMLLGHTSLRRDSNYLAFLQDQLNPMELLQNVPLQLEFNHWFQQDSAPPHFARNVRAYLNQV